MASVQQIYNEVTFDLLEDFSDGAGPGLSLGIITFAQFIDILNDTLIDFLKRTGLVKIIYTQQVVQGTGQYAFPDTMMLIESAYLAGRFLSQSTIESTYGSSRDWKTVLEFPRSWHQDSLPIKTVELAPYPNYNSLVFSPQTGDWAVLVSAVLTQAPVHRGLTLLGTQKLALVAAVGDPIPLIPDEWALGYLPFGVLYRIWSGDNEDKDPDRAAWALANYEEGISIGQAITQSEVLDG